MKNKALTIILLFCIFISLNGCVYSHNYDNDGNEMNESEVNAKIDEIINEIKDFSPTLNNSQTTTPDEAATMETLEFRGTTYYLVFNETQLRAIGTGEYGMDKNYMQQADIQMSEEEWIPIGTEDKPFAGGYNGNGFEIKGLTMTEPDAKVIGFFGYAKDAHIQHLSIQGYQLNSSSAFSICDTAYDCIIEDCSIVEHPAQEK